MQKISGEPGKELVKKNEVNEKAQSRSGSAIKKEKGQSSDKNPFQEGSRNLTRGKLSLFKMSKFREGKAWFERFPEEE